MILDPTGAFISAINGQGSFTPFLPPTGRGMKSLDALRRLDLLTRA